MATRKFCLIPLLALAGCPLLALVGCAEGPVKPDPAPLAALRDKYLLEVEPAGAITAQAWRDRQADPGEAVELGAPAEDSDRLTLVGVVGGMPSPFGTGVEKGFPWKAGSPTFFLVDPEVPSEFADHEADDDHAANCPFCAKKAQEKLPLVAAVTFGGETLPGETDARSVFPIKQGDTVVVRGKPSEVGKLLTVEADGLFVRKE